MFICVISMLMSELLKHQIYHCSSVTALASKHKTLQRTGYCLLYLDLKSVIRKGSIPQTQLKSFMIEEEIKGIFQKTKNKKSTALKSLYRIKRNKSSNGVFSVSSHLHNKQTSFFFREIIKHYLFPGLLMVYSNITAHKEFSSF